MRVSNNATLHSVNGVSPALDALPGGLTLYNNPALSHCEAERLAARFAVSCQCPGGDRICDASCAATDEAVCPCETIATCTCTGSCECSGNDNTGSCAP
jgi:hypothetical protein